MIVIDASSLAKYILRENNWGKIRKYLEENEVHSLNLALIEISNAIWKHVLHGRISRKEAMIAFEAVKMLRDIVIFESFENYLDDAVKISIENKISIYDALYIAQAHKYGIMITSDKLQMQIAHKMDIKVEYIE